MKQKWTLLSRGQLALFRIGIAAAVLLVGNSAYLFFAGMATHREDSFLPLTYQGMLIVHFVLSAVVVLLAAVFIARHLPRVVSIGNRRARIMGITLTLILLGLLASGLIILIDANNEDNRWLLHSHRIMSVLILLFYLKHRLASRDAPTIKQITAGLSVVFGAALVLYATQWLESQQYTPTPETTKIVNSTPFRSNWLNPFQPFQPLGDPDPESPFFPSKATTADHRFLSLSDMLGTDDFRQASSKQEVSRQGFVAGERIGVDGCARCHQAIVDQWAASAHRFSSFNNPFYAASIDFTREQSGFKKSQFCGGCHDPALLFTGLMQQPIDKQSVAAQAGLNCFSCHAINRVNDLTGNGNFNLQADLNSPYLFANAEDGLGRLVHDYLLRAKPDAHKKQMLKPVFRQSEYCLSCHKVNLDVHVNDYRWLRGQNEYDAWQNSGVAHNQPMTWYQPDTVRQCQDCHMAPETATKHDLSANNGKVSSHRFLAANTALPYIRDDREMLDKTEAFLQQQKLRVDIFAIHRLDNEAGEIVMAPDQRLENLRAGEKIQVDVVVRNLGVGHTFPGGTNDSNEGWLYFRALAGDRTIFSNGELRQDRTVDPAAHFYKAMLVDKHGQRINKRNALDIYTKVYANVIGPSASDIARYRFTVPPELAGETLRIDARLHWRKFDREFTEFTFKDGDVPDLPITVIAKDSLHIGLGNVDGRAQATRLSDSTRPPTWQRFNDYGIGLFIDNDTRGALRAFREVAGLNPQLADGYLNQARVYLKEGNLQEADALLAKAATLAPERPQIAFFQGMLLEKAGRFGEAATAYHRALPHYPGSRGIRLRLGQVYWLSNKIEKSIEMYREVLDIDPENREAFHQLSLAYQALAAETGDAGLREKYRYAAGQMQSAFQKYKLDENAQKVTHDYRMLHPHDNLMSQDIIIHAE